MWGTHKSSFTETLCWVPSGPEYDQRSGGNGVPGNPVTGGLRCHGDVTGSRPTTTTKYHQGDHLRDREPLPDLADDLGSPPICIEVLVPVLGRGGSSPPSDTSSAPISARQRTGAGVMWSRSVLGCGATNRASCASDQVNGGDGHATHADPRSRRGADRDLRVSGVRRAARHDDLDVPTPSSGHGLPDRFVARGRLRRSRGELLLVGHEIGRARRRCAESRSSAGQLRGRSRSPYSARSLPRVAEDPP